MVRKGKRKRELEDEIVACPFETSGVPEPVDLGEVPTSNKVGPKVPMSNQVRPGLCLPQGETNCDNPQGETSGNHHPKGEALIEKALKEEENCPKERPGNCFANSFVSGEIATKNNEDVPKTTGPEPEKIPDLPEPKTSPTNLKEPNHNTTVYTDVENNLGQVSHPPLPPQTQPMIQLPQDQPGKDWGCC